MSRYGRRYLTAREFSSYCSDLNVELKPFNQELELYEKEGVLLPAACVIKPNEYVVKRRQLDQQPETYGQSLPEWEELERLLHHGTDTDLWHPFDREFEKQNRYLFRPSHKSYRPWDSFYTEVESSAAETFRVPTVEHYYHYWQVHEVYLIHKKYPIFAKHNWVLQNLKKEARKESYLKPEDPNLVATFHGKAKYFDALSFYIELYSNEERKTFAAIPATNGFKQLNNDQFDHYQRRQAGHTSFVAQRYNLSVEELYQFLVHLLELRTKYQRAERIRLRNELGNDVLFLTRFINSLTGQPFGEIEEEVGKRASFWTKTEFRHLDRALEVQDYARNTFERLRSQYNEMFPGFRISPTDINEMLRFIDERDLFIIPYAIFDIDETLNSPRSFRRTSLYIGLGNLTTGLECYLREIANTIPSDTVQTNSLFNLVKTMFSDWGQKFENEYSVRQGRAQSDAIWYITDVYTDPNLDTISRAFLIAHRARNLVAHNYILDHYMYHNLYGIVYTAICHALFYSWAYGAQKGWV